jgi:hypothetical protein
MVTQVGHVGRVNDGSRFLLPPVPEMRGIINFGNSFLCQQQKYLMITGIYILSYQQKLKRLG